MWCSIVFNSFVWMHQKINWCLVHNSDPNINEKNLDSWSHSSVVTVSVVKKSLHSLINIRKQLQIFIASIYKINLFSNWYHLSFVNKHASQIYVPNWFHLMHDSLMHQCIFWQRYIGPWTSLGNIFMQSPICCCLEL